MSQEQTLLMVVVAFLFIHILEVRSKKDKILCTLRLNNKTKVKKWAKFGDDHVYLGTWQFNIVERCVCYDWFSGGLTCWLTPMRVATLDYDETNEDPFNPDDMSDTRVITPRVRKSINNRDRMGAFAAGIAAQGGKKKGGLTDLLPWLAILGVAIVGFFVYQMYQNNMALFNQVQQIQATLRSLVK